MNAEISPIEKKWSVILRQLIGKISEAEFQEYVLPLDPEVNERGEIQLIAPFRFFADRVRKDFGAVISAVAGRFVSIKAAVGSRAPSTRPWRREFTKEGKLPTHPELPVAPVCIAEPPSAVADDLPDVVRVAHLSPSDEIGTTHIMATVAKFFVLSVEELVSRDHSKRVAWPRHIAIYLCREYTSISFSDLAKMFDDRHHSSIMRAVDVVVESMKNDTAFLKKVNKIWKLLGSPKKVVRKVRSKVERRSRR